MSKSKKYLIFIILVNMWLVGALIFGLSPSSGPDVNPSTFMLLFFTPIILDIILIVLVARSRPLDESMRIGLGIAVAGLAIFMISIFSQTLK